MTKRAVFITEPGGEAALVAEHVTDESWDLVAGAVAIAHANAALPEDAERGPLPTGSPRVELVSEDGTVLEVDVTNVVAIGFVDWLDGESAEPDVEPGLSPEAAALLEDEPF